MNRIRSLRSLYSRSLSRGRGRLADDSSAPVDHAAAGVEGSLGDDDTPAECHKLADAPRGRSRSRPRMRMPFGNHGKAQPDNVGDVIMCVSKEGLSGPSSSSRSRSRSLFRKKEPQSSRRFSTNTAVASSGACIEGSADPASPQQPMPMVELPVAASPMYCDVIDSTPETRTVMRNISRLGMEDPVLKHLRESGLVANRRGSMDMPSPDPSPPHPSKIFDQQFADPPKSANGTHHNVDADVEHEYLNLENDDCMSNSLFPDHSTVVSDHTATSQEGLDRQLYQRSLLRTPSTRSDHPTENRMKAPAAFGHDDIVVSPRKVRVKVHCKSLEDLQAAVEQHRHSNKIANRDSGAGTSRTPQKLTAPAPGPVKERVATALEARQGSQRTVATGPTVHSSPYCVASGAGVDAQLLPTPQLQRRPSMASHDGNVSIHKSPSHPNRVVVKIRVKKKKGSDLTADGEVAELLSSAFPTKVPRRPSLTPRSSPTEPVMEKHKWGAPRTEAGSLVSLGLADAGLPPTKGVSESCRGKPTNTVIRHRAMPSSMDSIFAPPACRTQRFPDERIFVD